MNPRKIFTVCLLLVSVNLLSPVAYSSSDKIQTNPSAENLEAFGTNSSIQSAIIPENDYSYELTFSLNAWWIYVYLDGVFITKYPVEE